MSTARHWTPFLALPGSPPHLRSWRHVLWSVFCSALSVSRHLLILPRGSGTPGGGLPALGELESRTPHSSGSFHAVFTLVCCIKTASYDTPAISFISFSLSATLTPYPMPFPDNLLEIPVQLVTHEGLEGGGSVEPSWGALTWDEAATIWLQLLFELSRCLT